MIYLGDNKIGNIYSGENKIDKIYKGEELVYSSGLPKGTVFDFDYTGSAQQIELPGGRYLLEVWGTSSSGKGGYSKGVLRLKKDVILNCYIGGSPVSRRKTFNGGGQSDVGGSGAGATDIRINSNSLYSRVIVAGGGGGNGMQGYSSTPNPGGVGGGLSGGDGRGSWGGSGGTQTSGYSFGVGEDHVYGGGGGGGWYGGGSGYGSSSEASSGGGGGGSGYVHTPDSHKPEGWLLTEEHFLTDAETIAGNQTMPNPTGGTQVGHTGSGYARITVI